MWRFQIVPGIVSVSASMAAGRFLVTCYMVAIQFRPGVLAGTVAPGCVVLSDFVAMLLHTTGSGFSRQQVHMQAGSVRPRTQGAECDAGYKGESRYVFFHGLCSGFVFLCRQLHAPYTSQAQQKKHFV